MTATMTSPSETSSGCPEPRDDGSGAGTEGQHHRYRYHACDAHPDRRTDLLGRREQTGRKALGVPAPRRLFRQYSGRRPPRQDPAQRNAGREHQQHQRTIRTYGCKTGDADAEEGEPDRQHGPETDPPDDAGSDGCAGEASETRRQEDQTGLKGGKTLAPPGGRG